MQADFDHVGFAVSDAGRALRNLYGAGIILPIAGEEDDEFRWVIGRRQDRSHGIRVELLDANRNENSFLARYLRSHGEGAHHVTFMVSDIDRTLAHLRDTQIPVTQVDLSYPPWREVFIHPSSGLGTVVQVASSIYTYPSGRHAVNPIDPEHMPHRQTGRHRDWWQELVDPAAEPAAVTITEISMGAADPDCARRLFTEVLGGRHTAERPGHARYDWSSGSINVTTAENPDIDRVYFEPESDRDSPTPEFAIGRTLLRPVDPVESPNGVQR